MVILPYVFQTSGWVVPTLIFILFGSLAAISSLFIIEASSRFPGNENFQVNVEYTVLVHQFFGRYPYYVLIFILYGSLQSVNIASIVGSAQAFDSLFVGILKGTCGYLFYSESRYGISPISGVYCVYESTDQNSPFGTNYMFATLGYMLVAAIIIPLTNLDINDNIIFQLLSLMYNFAFLFTLIGMTISNGFHPQNMPAFGSDFSNGKYFYKYIVIGNVLFNFALANTVPSVCLFSNR
jgi:hypothetical protein